jgi:spore germination protein YaaH
MFRHKALRHAVVLCALLGSTLFVGPSNSPVSAAPAPLRSSELSHRLTAEVMGYLPYWELNDRTVANLDYNRLTTIAFFSVGWNSAGHLVTTAPGYTALMSDRATTVINAAHAAGVRAIVSFTSFGYDKNAAFFSNSTARATFVREAAALVVSRGLDGADLDVELIKGTYFGAYAATAGSLTTRMRQTNPIAYSTVATNANTSGAQMASRALAAGVSRAFLMGYNYRTALTSPVGSIDPRVRAGGGLSLTTTLDMYAAAGAPLKRVLLGLPFYGRTWQTVDTSMRANRVSGTKGAVFLVRNLTALRAEGTILAADYDTVESSARLVRRVDGKIYQTYYDSTRSFAAKFALVYSRGLAGIGFWTLGYDGGGDNYWNLVGKTFGPPVISSIRVRPSPSNTRHVRVYTTWADHDHPATLMRLANAGSGIWTSWRTISANTWFTLPASRVPVKRTIRVQLRDSAGALSSIKSATVYYDPVKPKMTRLTLWWSTTASAWRIRYSATDVGSGVESYRIRIYRNGVWTVVQPERTTSSYTIRLPHSANFTVSVAAHDKAWNISTGLYRSS